MDNHSYTYIHASYTAVLCIYAPCVHELTLVYAREGAPSRTLTISAARGRRHWLTNCQTSYESLYKRLRRESRIVDRMKGGTRERRGTCTIEYPNKPGLSRARTRADQISLTICTKYSTLCRSRGESREIRSGLTSFGSGLPRRRNFARFAQNRVSLTPLKLMYKILITRSPYQIFQDTKIARDRRAREWRYRGHSTPDREILTYEGSRPVLKMSSRNEACACPELRAEVKRNLYFPGPPLRHDINSRYKFSSNICPLAF